MLRKMMFRANSLAAALMLTGTAMMPAISSAANYPDRPLRLIVPYATGGPTDLLARALADRMQQSIGQPVIVENKPGAGGILGVDTVAKSAADGYTLLFTASGTLVINPALNPNLPYKPEDLAPISSAASYDMLLAVNSSLPFKSLGDLIAYARKNPGELSFGSAGNGTSNHLAGELLKNIAGINLAHIPYKGNAAAMTDVMGGHISMMFDLPSTTLPYAKTGKIALLGATGKEASPLAPNVPPISQAGVPGYEVTSWFGVLAPAKTSPDIIAMLSRQIVEILKDPVIGDKLGGLGYKVSGSTPEQLALMIERDSKLWSDLIREANIKLE